jgi:hypothetical protein
LPGDEPSEVLKVDGVIGGGVVMAADCVAELTWCRCIGAEADVPEELFQCEEGWCCVSNGVDGGIEGVAEVK